MSLREKIDRALHVEYTCAVCGSPIADGERFAIIGVMSREIRRGDIARIDIHIRTLGRLRCARCMKADAGRD